MNRKRKYFISICLLILLLQSCASKKDVLYLQDVKTDTPVDVGVSIPTLQPNDILSVKITALNLEAAQPYNIEPLIGAPIAQNVDAIKLQGYLVSPEYTITLPNIGAIEVKGLTVEMLENRIKSILVESDRLRQPSVLIRLLNSKVTVMGEVKAPGTYEYTEQSITLPQALGYAGDLTINGNRQDVTLIRQVDGVQVVKHIDLTTSEWIHGEFYYIKQNDVIYVNPNMAKVKSAGFIGNAATVLTLASVILSSVVLITR